MEFKELLHCKTLDFQPLHRPSAHCPSFIYKNWQISGFNSNSKYGWQLKGSFEDAIKSVYPILTLPELGRFFHIAQECEISWTLLFQKYNLKYDEELKRILDLLLKTPTSFQNWVSEKNLGARDLKVLIFFHKEKSLNELFPVLHLLSFAPKNIGVKILEWSSELLVLGQTLDTVVKNSDNFDNWYKHLYNLRYPVASNRDKEFQNKVIATPWPRHVHADWKRQGDQSGIEVQFFCFGPEDFNKKIQGLTQLKDKIQSIWNPT